MKSLLYIGALVLLMLGMVAIPSNARAEEGSYWEDQNAEPAPRRRVRRMKRSNRSRSYYRQSGDNQSRRVRRTRASRRTRRSLASYSDTEGQSYASYRGYDGRSEDTLDLKLGIVAGLSMAKDNLSTAGGFSNPFVGIRGDLQYKYFGVELDSYYGLSATRSSESDLFVGGTATDEQKFSILGGDISVKGQYPIRIGGGARLIPKVGGGFSLMRETSSQTDVGAEVRNISTVTGFHALAGFDLYPVAKLLISGDFLMGLGGSAKTTVEDISGSQSTSAGANFTRIRAGAFYEVASHFLMGAQFTRRTSSIQDSLVGQSHNQFLGVFLYSF